MLWPGLCMGARQIWNPATQMPLMNRPWAALLIHSQQTKLNFSITVPTNQEFGSPPVTPYNSTNQIVNLPVPLLMHALLKQSNVWLTLLLLSLTTQHCVNLTNFYLLLRLIGYSPTSPLHISF